MTSIRLILCRESIERRFQALKCAQLIARKNYDGWFLEKKFDYGEQDGDNIFEQNFVKIKKLGGYLLNIEKYVNFKNVSKSANFLYSGVYDYGEHKFKGIFEFWLQEGVESENFLENVEFSMFNYHLNYFPLTHESPTLFGGEGGFHLSGLSA
jgi:hypothetical protein